MGRASVSLCAGLLAGISFVGESAGAAGPLQPRTNPEELALPALGTVVTVGPLSQINTFEIAAYIRANQKSAEDTQDFERVLGEIPVWRSKIDPTEETYLALRKKCIDNNSYCDVVSLVETVTGSTMTLEIYVYTTPESHRAFHTGKLDINGKTEDCSEQIMGEKSCREALMHGFAMKLAGLDKLHPLPAGNK
jgi:hypothetical protein